MKNVLKCAQKENVFKKKYSDVYTQFMLYSNDLLHFWLFKEEDKSNIYIIIRLFYYSNSKMWLDRYQGCVWIFLWSIPNGGYTPTDLLCIIPYVNGLQLIRDKFLGRFLCKTSEPPKEGVLRYMTRSLNSR